MIKKLALLSVLFLFFISCRSNDDDLDNQQFVGAWNWVSTNGGFGGIQETPSSTGINRTITFTANNHYTIKENDAVVKEGTYTIKRDITNIYHSEKVFIDFSDYQYLIVENVTANDLSLAIDVYDGFTYHYSR